MQYDWVGTFPPKKSLHLLSSTMYLHNIMQIVLHVKMMIDRRG
jgi:hypothetical protein